MSNEQITREQAQANLDAAIQGQTTARAALAAAVAAVNNAKADVMDSDAKVLLAKSALQRLGGPIQDGTNKGATTGQSDLCAAVTMVLRASATPLTVDQIIAQLQAGGVQLSGNKPRENLTAYISRWSKVPGASIVSKGRGLWAAAGAPEVPAFLATPPEGQVPNAAVTAEPVKGDGDVDVPPFLAPPTVIEKVYPLMDTEPEQDSDDEADGTPLPDGFPGRQALADAGFSTYESIADKTHDQLRRIKGIGAETARLIRASLDS